MATLAEIILAQGQSAANARRRSGERSAQMWTNLADIVGTTAQTWAREREEAPLREMKTKTAQLELSNAEATASDRESERKMAADLRALFASGQPPDPWDIVAITGPERGLRIVEGLNALKPDPRQEFEDTQKVLRDVLRGYDALPEETRAETYADVRANLVQRGIIKPEDAPETYDPNWWAATRQYGEAPQQPKTRQVEVRNPDGSTSIQIVEDTPGQSFTSAAEEKPDTRPLNVQLADAIRRGDREGMNAIRRAMREAEAISRPPTSNDPGPLETIIGPDGKPIRVPRAQAIGQTPYSGTSKPATGLEKRALNFFNRARQAETDIEGMEEQVQNLGLGGQTWMAIAPNFMQTELGQQYTQAQRAFTEARLRKDSGAAIPDTEFENDRKTYFAQPGDSKETLEQKRRARAAVLASLGFESGQALAEFVGDVDEARTIVDSYKQRSERGAAVKPTTRQNDGRLYYDENGNPR